MTMKSCAVTGEVVLAKCQSLWGRHEVYVHTSLLGYISLVAFEL